MTYDNEEQCMTLDEIALQMRDAHAVVMMKELNIDVQRLYQALYEQHRSANGSLSGVTFDYWKRLSERYDFIWCNIYETIEAQIVYNQKAQGHTLDILNESRVIY